MAEYTYPIDSFNMSSTIVYGDFGSEVTALSGANKTLTVKTADLRLNQGEVIEDITLTGEYSLSGGYSYVVHAGGLPFYDGSVSLDTTSFTEGQDFTVQMYFCLDRVALGDGAQTVESSTVTKTMYFYDMQLTITTRQTIVQLTAPHNLLLNGEEFDLSGQQRDMPLVLSWDQPSSEGIAGYEILRCTFPSSDYELFASTTGETSCQISSGSKGYESHTYKVKAIAANDSGYTDAELSDESRITLTKFTNVHYYHDGRWYLGEVNYYDGSTWLQKAGQNYHNGSAWVMPGFN